MRQVLIIGVIMAVLMAESSLSASVERVRRDAQEPSKAESESSITNIANSQSNANNLFGSFGSVINKNPQEFFDMISALFSQGYEGVTGGGSKH